MRRVAGMVGSLLLGGVFVAFGPASSACACSCVSADPKDYLDWADAAFVGVVVDVDRPLISGAGPITVDLVVESVLKGTPGKSITVATSDGEASCGYRFRPGNRYRVYTSQGRTGLCSGNELLGPTPEIPVSGSSPTTWVLVAIGVVLPALAGAGLWLHRRRLRSRSPHTA